MIDAGLASATDALPTVKPHPTVRLDHTANCLGHRGCTGPGGEIFRQEYPRNSNFDPQKRGKSQFKFRNTAATTYLSFPLLIPPSTSDSSTYQPLHLSTAPLFVLSIKSCSVYRDHLHLLRSSSVRQTCHKQLPRQCFDRS